MSARGSSSTFLSTVTSLPARLAVTLGLGVLLCSAPFACAASGGDFEGSEGGGGLGFQSGTGGGPGPDSECAIGTDEARLVQANIFIMYDKSGSMIGPKWTESTKALQAFFMDPESAGLKVALRFFPDTGCDVSCNANACADPLVPLGELTELSAPTDVHEQALIDAFIGQSPAGGTPLSAALDGGLLWAGGVLDAEPYDKAVVVLVTDGAPENCQDDASYFTNAAAQAYTNRGILTFAIGLEGSNVSLMNAIAGAGGTVEGFFIGTENFQQELVAALQAIRELAIACEYDVPQQLDGSPVDPEEINVLYTPSGSSSSITIGRVPNASACGDATGGGWYYDDPISPSSIIFCPATCAGVQADLEAQIELLFGCSTVPA